MSRRKKVTMADIANELDVSVVTVSKALSGKDGVSDELRKRIEEVSEELGYVAPRDNESDSDNEDSIRPNLNVGILIAGHYFQNSNSFYFDLYQLMIKRLADLGFYGIVEIITEEEISKRHVPQFLKQKYVAGLVVLGQFPQQYLEDTAAFKVPSIYVDFDIPQIKEDCIVQDNVNGSYLATEYLIQLGHRKIAYVGSIKATTSIMERYLGYHRAMLTYDLPVRREWILEDRDQRGFFIDVVLPEDLPTAFVCNNDEGAAALIKQFAKQGIRVPEDVSVIAFDNTIYSTLSDPPLTTVAVDADTMAIFTVDDLLRKIRKRDAQWRHSCKVVEVELTVRGSVSEPQHVKSV